MYGETTRYQVATVVEGKKGISVVQLFSKVRIIIRKRICCLS